MIATHSGSIRLFRFSGIQVFLHWSWFLVAMIELSLRRGSYNSLGWNIAEYVMLFVIVTLHEFGHALACRQTGGQAHEIVLWPLGGIAFVSPPQRPGATLWSIAAGPLVNVVLVPILGGLLLGADYLEWLEGNPDLAHFLLAVNVLNGVLLVFNLLPVYPLDGGQILRSVLWYGLGRARSLQVASYIGLAGIAAGVAWRVITARSTETLLWTGLMALFLVQRCWIGLKEAKYLMAIERLPRHTGVRCPSCHAAPPGGPLYLCVQCRQPMDPFSTRAVCPHCQATQPALPCVYCGVASPIERWETR
ncbi:site-2 protease family protein [Opitutus sp. ER46]|uniref:M50 family metallopeptidase n=1 Tax=Opitutus sp. ER46 TaxID=2161864 RepID=UPI000D3070C0|nr:site-2 protease family protein [Opitutus sp. ER46]PTX91323.1 peptidase M50 [Opitutus sp. ER46]